MDAIRLLSGLLGNKSLSSGLGGQLLGGLLGGGGRSGGGGLGNILGSVLGGGGQQQSGGGGLGGMLGGLLGGGGGSQAPAPAQQAGGGGLGGLLGAVLGGGEPPKVAPEVHAEANDQAKILIRAMVNAAKSDGRIDQSEQEKIVSKLGDDVSQEEIQFLKEEFAAPLDVQAFARTVPRGLEEQVYFLSLTSIDLDTQGEAQYLGQLAQSMNLDPKVCNEIHDQVKAPRIFK